MQNIYSFSIVISLMQSSTLSKMNKRQQTLFLGNLLKWNSSKNDSSTFPKVFAWQIINQIKITLTSTQQLEWANSRNGCSRFKSTRLHLLVGSVCGLRFAVTTKKSGDSRVIYITFTGKCVNSQNPHIFINRFQIFPWKQCKEGFP